MMSRARFAQAAKQRKEYAVVIFAFFESSREPSLGSSSYATLVQIRQSVVKFEMAGRV